MSIYLGVGLALCSTACSATGYTLQKYAHNRYDAEVRRLKAEAEGTPASTTPNKSNTTGTDGIGGDGEVKNEQTLSNQSESGPPLESARDAIHTGASAFPLVEHDLDAPSGSQQSSENDKVAAKPRSFWKYWQFPAGLGLLIVGTVFAAFVFGLAPQSTLAPLGSVTMILNTILSWKFLGESFTRIDALSLGLMACGTTVAVLFGKSSEPKYTIHVIVDLFLDRPEAWGLAIGAACAITACIIFIYTVGKRPINEMTPLARRIDVFARAFTGAAWSGYSNYASKAVVEVAFNSVREKTIDDWKHPPVYVLGFVLFSSLILQVKFLNVGLAKYDSMIVVRLYQAFLAIFSILSGFFYFNEVADQTPFSVGIFCLGVGIVLCGIAVGMLRRPNSTLPPKAKPEVETVVVTDVDAAAAAAAGGAGGGAAGTGMPMVLIAAPPPAAFSTSPASSSRHSQPSGNNASGLSFPPASPSVIRTSPLAGPFQLGPQHLALQPEAPVVTLAPASPSAVAQQSSGGEAVLVRVASPPELPPLPLNDNPAQRQRASSHASAGPAAVQPEGEELPVVVC